ncbi:MAG TPA: amidohydrolase [Candidatus Sulfotelmatobacter sp.]|jgi:hippurate hydrolase|nr:amidohydrolase [Candidatus Sulfotelmatobacter sp.]
MKLGKILLLLSLAGSAFAQSSTSKEVENAYPDAHAFYLDVHQNPELSTHETQTAAKLASRLRSLGYEVTEHVGGTGIVAILKNGPGPTVMLRTELDALPVEEKTGLAYASKVRAKDDAGRDVPVMHACGHDLHMASILGTAAIMAHTKESWHGTLMLIGQPAEETIGGAKAMIDDGFLKRFPKPDVAVALHVGNILPAGVVGITPGIYNTNADSLRITIYGKGGHGSAPHTAIDPIVIAARTILALQTIASREVKPQEMAVVTVGYIQAGTKNNIIPDQAELGLTVRTNKPEVRKQVLAAIARITKAEAEAAGAPRLPTIDRYEGTDLVYNDPALAQRLRGVLEAALGKDRVVTQEPITGSEDFSYFIEQGIPGFYFSLGGADPEKYTQAKAAGTMLPSNHSSLFAPDVDPALHTGIAAEVAVLRNLLSRSADDLRKTLAERTAASR